MRFIRTSTSRDAVRTAGARARSPAGRRTRCPRPSPLPLRLFPFPALMPTHKIGSAARSRSPRPSTPPAHLTPPAPTRGTVRVPTPERGVSHSHYAVRHGSVELLERGREERVPSDRPSEAYEVECCAHARRTCPLPLTTVHFHDLSPVAGGGARVQHPPRSASTARVRRKRRRRLDGDEAFCLSPVP